MSLQQFISKVGQNGVARNNKFLVYFPVTIGKGNVPLSNADLPTWYAESVDIPGTLINTAPVRIQGKRHEMPVEFAYSGTLNMVFLVDMKLHIRDYFTNWMNLVIPNSNAYGFNPGLPDNYRTTIQIEVHENFMEGAESLAQTSQKENKNPLSVFEDSLTKSFRSSKSSPTKSNTTEKVVALYEFQNIYPKSINGPQLSNAGRDFQRLNVSFEFEYMEVEFPEKGEQEFDKPSLTKGTGTGLLGSVNGIAGRLGSTIGGVGNQISGGINRLANIQNGSLNDILGL